ncbi:right-handed parallel beta-helix repeat-containing protein [Sulfurospirillum sp. 1612]|uniref:right-handed parallel beta-helix repeat-containing protein n=1 Tax=Sulfurospirillum sp. 1612 TaxID=3094835 RepID=UPI002F920116
MVVDNTLSFFGFLNCEGLSLFSSYSTIQGALDDATDGDTIKICKGDYNEQDSVLVDNLTITNGADVYEPSDVNWYNNGDVLVVGDSSHSPKNLVVQNVSLYSTSNSSNSKAIRINYAQSKITLNNLLIKTDGADGVYGSYNVNNDLQGVFKNLTIESGGSGIYISQGGLQDFENIAFTLSGNSANDTAIKLQHSVADENHIFKHLSFDVGKQPAIALSSGKQMIFEDINITASNYTNNTNAIASDYGTTVDDLTFNDINISLNKGTGIEIEQGNNINVDNCTISGSTQYAFHTGSGIDGALTFKNIAFDTNGNYGLLVQEGTDVTINNATISGSSGNGWGIKTDWSVTGSLDFSDINVTAHAGGIKATQGDNAVFENVRINSDSSSSNDNGLEFDSSTFENITISNCDINATGNALQVNNASGTLNVNASKLTTNGNYALYLKTGVMMALIENSCFYNTSSSGNSYAMYLYNWHTISVNNNCIYALNGGNYAYASSSYDWDGNYWDGVSDSSGDGAISRDDTTKISTNIVDNNPLTMCQNSCGGGTDFTLKECYYDNFNRASLGERWSIISTGTYPPDITDNKLMLTKNHNNIASGVSLVGKFPAQNNLVQIEFEHNAYGGSGADGMTIVFSDANTTPVAGASGGSLGYAQKTGISGFAGGWLGFGLDEYGNFSNPTEGRVGGTSLTKDALAIRGSEGDNYQYIAGTGTLSPGIDDTSASTPAPNYKYKFIIDTRNSQTLITVYRDTLDGNGYVLLSNMDEVNATQSASSPENFRFSLTGSTGGSTNYHSLDDLNISAANCGTLGKLAENPNSYFDAWEVGASYNVSNRVIKTKIVKQNFNLNIFALNESNTDYQDFNGTVCASVVDSNTHKVLSNWVKLLFDATNPYVNVATFNSEYASHDAQIDLVWKENVDTTCPISDEDNSTRSTDHFAIRPLKFTIDTNTTSLYAGVPFRLDINASNNSGGNSLDYNETNGTSYTISISDSNATCPSGSLGNVPDPIQFSNGGVSFTPKYSDVGDVNITIKENLGSEFAYIDHNDSSDTERLIPTVSKTITFNPYRFAIIDASFVRDPNQDWRYMANVDDTNISLSFKVQAQNADGDVTKKFDRYCYSHDVGVTIDVNATSSDGNISYTQFINNTMTTAHDKNLSNPDFNATINDQNFTEGNSSLVMYALNVYRQHNIPKDPLTMTMEDINTSYPTDVNVLNPGLVLENNDSQFYYGRVKTHDIDTNKQSALFDLQIEVYSTAGTSYVSGFHQNSTHWYQMQKDSSTQMSALLPKKDFTLSEDENNINAITPTQNTTLGIDRFTISNTWSNSNSAYIHVKSPAYLWFNHYKDYNDSNTSDCSQHPCFKYNYFHKSTAVLIQSGDFNGTDIGNEYNQTNYIKSGVKVFR